MNQIARTRELATLQRLAEDGNYLAAEQQGRRMLARNPRDADVLNILGSIAYMRDNFSESTAYLEQCLALQPKNPVVWCNLSMNHTAQGRSSEAMAALETALRLSPGDANAISGKAALLEKLGEDAKIRDLLGPRFAAGTATPGMAVIYAKMLGRAKEHQQAVDLLQRHLAIPGVPPNTLRALWFELGRACEKLKDFEQSFKAFETGNRIQAVPFVESKFLKDADEIMDTFSAKNLAILPRSTLDSRMPVFIAGMPRSGTTLTEQIIDAHPMAHGAGEIEELHDVVRYLQETFSSAYTYPDCMGDLTVEKANAAGRQYLDIIEPLAKGAARLVDKSLSNYKHLGLISLLFPKARVIWCRRDPMDCLLSCFTQDLNPKKHAYCTELKNLGFMYRLFERYMRHWVSVLDYPILELHYEELVADQEGQSRRIIEFCGLPWDEKCLNFHETGRVVQTLSYDQVRRPMYKTSVARWKHFEPWLGPLKEGLGWNDDGDTGQPVTSAAS